MQYKIIVDKQPRTNPSSEKKEYIIDIEELRVKSNVYDSLNIEMDKTYVTRRLSLSEYGVLSVLDTPVIEELIDVDIELFEGDNYIYLLDMEGNHFYAEYVLKNDFTNIFTSKAELNSAINQTARNVEISVNQKLENYSTTEEMNAAIDVRADEINLELSKKVDDEELTGANITLRINEDTSEATINADKININGAISANGNFKVDTSGNMTCNNATFTGGKITLSGTQSNPDLSLSNDSAHTSVASDGIYANTNNSTSKHAYLYTDETGGGITLGGNATNDITLRAGTSAYIRCIGDMYANEYNYNSLEKFKKDISKVKIEALNIVKNAELYEFNYKTESENSRKHIGFIIGDSYKTPNEVIANNGEGINVYNMCSVLWKAVQEMSEEIKQLKEVQHD